MRQKGDHPVVARAKESGITPGRLVVSVVLRLGNLNKAAEELGCNPGSIRRWLLQEGYIYVPPPQRGTLKKVTIEE